MTYCKLLLCSALLLKFYFFAFSLNVFLSFNWLMMFHKWAILSAWVCYLTQLRVFSDALWIRCTVCIEYSPIYLNYLKPWTCVYLRYTSGTALRDTRTVGRYIFKRLCVEYHLRHLFYDSYLRHLFCDLYLRHLLYDLMNLHLFYKLLNWAWRLKYSRILCRRWLWWFSCWLICACDICCCLHAPDLDLTYLVAIVCLYTSVLRGVEQWYFGCHIWSMTWFVFILCVIYLSRHLLTCCHDFCCHPFIMVCYFTYNLNFILN